MGSEIYLLKQTNKNKNKQIKCLDTDKIQPVSPSVAGFSVSLLSIERGIGRDALKKYQLPTLMDKYQHIFFYFKPLSMR